MSGTCNREESDTQTTFTLNCSKTLLENICIIVSSGNDCGFKESSYN